MCARAAISCPSRRPRWGSGAHVLALAVWTALHAAHLDLPLAASWAVLAFMGLGVSLPSSPGFVGVIQARDRLGPQPCSPCRGTEALSFSLIFHAAQYFPVTLFGLVLLVVEQVSLTEATRGTRSPVASAPALGHRTGPGAVPDGPLSSLQGPVGETPARAMRRVQLRGGARRPAARGVLAEGALRGHRQGPADEGSPRLRLRLAR